MNGLQIGFLLYPDCSGPKITLAGVSYLADVHNAVEKVHQGGIAGVSSQR
jgi:hypothetical protein